MTVVDFMGIDQRVWKLTPYFMSYTLAKSALYTFTRTAAQALAPHIRVNAIGPGPTLMADRQSPAHFAQQRAACVLRRGSDPDDIVAAMFHPCLQGLHRADAGD